MTVTHDDDISITIRLDPPPATRAGFGTVLFLAPLSEASLDGNRVKTYKSLEEVESDQSSSFLGQSQVDAAAFAFAQEPKPDEIMIGNVDLGGSPAETYADGLQEVIDADPSFYGVCAQTRTDTETATLASAVETHEKPMLCAIQSSLSDLLATPTDPLLDSTDLSSVAGNERTIIEYHDRSGAYADVAHLVGRLGFDPDRQSAPWDTHLYGAGAAQDPISYSAPLEGSDRDNLIDNHANAISSFGSSDHYLKPGQTAAGRPAYVQLTADWFKTRLETDIALEVQDASRDGEKIPIGQTGETRTRGQVQMAKLVRARFQQGEANGHFVPGSSEIGYPPITSQNITEQTIPLEGSAVLEAHGHSVTFTFEFERG
mgnify:CR=1 FL=1